MPFNVLPLSRWSKCSNLLNPPYPPFCKGGNSQLGVSIFPPLQKGG